MPSGNYYRTQAELFMRMALACSELERAARLTAQARLFLNRAGQTQGGGGDLNVLLEEFNHQQLLKPDAALNTAKPAPKR
jgi:hypothetical protein